jgi:hypothetical protein
MKKSLKTILLKAFFRKNFLESDRKKDLVVGELQHSLKWALGFTLFIGICVLLVYLFGF